VFLDSESDSALAVVGLTDRLRDLLGGSGVYLETGVVEYAGRYVCDGPFRSLADLGPNYRQSLTELILFGVRGKLRTLAPGRRQENIILSRKQQHSRKPDALYDLIEQCSPGPYLELFARYARPGWTQWGNESPARTPDVPHLS
jgi:hypothetical protein